MQPAAAAPAAPDSRVNIDPTTAHAPRGPTDYPMSQVRAIEVRLGEYWALAVARCDGPGGEAADVEFLCCSRDETAALNALEEYAMADYLIRARVTFRPRPDAPENPLNVGSEGPPYAPGSWVIVRDTADEEEIRLHERRVYLLLYANPTTGRVERKSKFVAAQLNMSIDEFLDTHTEGDEMYDQIAAEGARGILPPAVPEEEEKNETPAATAVTAVASPVIDTAGVVELEAPVLPEQHKEDDGQSKPKVGQVTAE